MLFAAVHSDAIGTKRDIGRTEIPQCSGLLPYPWACYPLDELGVAPPIRFRTFQDFPKDLPSRSVAR
jgi:hypothetical protein